MRRQFNAGRGLVGKLSLEAEGDEAAKSEIGDNAESLETDLVEMSEDSAEQGETEAQTDEAVEVAEALESLRDSLQATVANGGLDKGGAAVLAISVNHMYSRVGFADNKAAVSLESFGGSSSRVGATQLALEDIKSKIAEIWKHIVDACKKAYEWVKAHFVKIFGAAEKLQKRAKALSTKAADMGSMTMKEKTFENASLFKALAVGGNVSATPATEVDKIVKVAAEVYGKCAEWGSTVGEEIAAAIEANDGNSLGKVKLNAFSFTASPATEADGFQAPPAGLQLTRTAEMMGGKAIIAQMPGSALVGKAAADIIGKVSMTIGAFNPKATAPAKETLNTLASNAAGAAADSVVKLADEIMAYKAKVDKVEKIQSRIVKAAEKAGSAGLKEDDKAKADDMKALQAFGASSSRIISNPAASFTPFALMAGKATLDYVEQSLKQYSAK